MGKLFEELKRRKVFRVAAVYAVVAWVLIQVTDVVLPTFGAPEWVNQTIIFLFVLGFFPTLIAAWAYEITPEGITPDSGVRATEITPASSLDRKLIYATFILVLLAVGFQTADRFLLRSETQAVATGIDSKSSDEQPSLRTELNLGNLENRPRNNGGFTTTMSFAPDGSQLVFTSYKQGKYRLHVRSLDQLESEIIAESDTWLEDPMVSPDGNWVVYNSSLNLLILPLGGGTPRLIAEDLGIEGYVWADNQSLVIKRGAAWYLYSLETEEEVLLSDDPNVFEFDNPESLPNSETFLFTTAPSPGNYAIEAYNFASGERTALINNGFAARYVNSGHIVFMRDDDLWAVPFDVQTLKIRGIERPVINGIENNYGGFSAYGAFAVSPDGWLIYLPGGSINNRTTRALTWLDKSGAEQLLDLPAGNYFDPALSPDGERLAVTVIAEDGSSDIWVHNFNQPGILNRVTTSGNADNPLWTPDGRDIIYSQIPRAGVSRVDASGVRPGEEFVTSDIPLAPYSFTPEGDLLFISAIRGAEDIYRFSERNVETPQQAVLNSEFAESQPSVSPDGQLLVYISDETGSQEVYLRPYPDVNSNKWRISINGGRYPQWSSKGNVLHYITADERLIAVDIQTEPDFLVGQRRELTLQDMFLVNAPVYDISPVDDRYLFMKVGLNENGQEVSTRTGEEPVLAVVVHNWFEELKRLAPPNPQ